MPVVKARKTGIHFKPPTYSPVFGEKKIRLTFKFVVWILGFRITVPAGFISDGASIPKYLWSLVGSPFDPMFIVAALVHDYLYDIGFNRKTADLIFKMLLIHCKVKKSRARVMYRAVRMFGGGAWK